MKVSSSFENERSWGSGGPSFSPTCPPGGSMADLRDEAQLPALEPRHGPGDWRKHEPAGEVLRHLRNAMNGVRGRFYKACAGDHQALSPSRTSWSIIYVLGTPHWIGTKLLQNVAHLPDECKYLISAFFKNVFTGVHAKQTYNHKGEEIFLFLIINN